MNLFHFTSKSFVDLRQFDFVLRQQCCRCGWFQTWLRFNIRIWNNNVKLGLYSGKDLTFIWDLKLQVLHFLFKEYWHVAYLWIHWKKHRRWRRNNQFLLIFLCQFLNHLFVKGHYVLVKIPASSSPCLIQPLCEQNLLLLNFRIPRPCQWKRWFCENPKVMIKFLELTTNERVLAWNE